MSQVLQQDDAPVTIAAFDEFLEGQRDQRSWELVDGRIVAMTNPSERHEQIVANLGAPLKLAMDRDNRRVYFGGMRVQRSDNARAIYKPRPDLLVRCGAGSTRNYVTDPLVVIEVLSPSTINLDRGEKLRFYQNLPTLVHYVLVYQDQMRVEHYAKRDVGWMFETLTATSDYLDLDAIGFQIALESIYVGVDPAP